MINLSKLLTKEQLNILSGCNAGLDLAADLAHARVLVYTLAEDPKSIYVYGQAQPQTQFMTKLPLLQGRTLRRLEEPLVNRVLLSRVSMQGKREWSLGTYVNVYIYPLIDSVGACFGAVAFEVKTEYKAEQEKLLLELAMQFLRTAEADKLNNNPNYARLTPNDGLLLVDSELVIRAANTTAQHILHLLGVEQLVGRRTNSVQVNWPLVGLVLKGRTAESKEFVKQGLHLCLRVLPLTDSKGSPWALAVVRDTTDIYQKDEELRIKSIVIKEIHHRVKNNLQTIASLLRLQSRRAQAAETKVVLRDCINRVNSIALVHESLSQQEGGTIDVQHVAQGICEAILSSMVNPELQLETEFELEAATLPSEAANAIALTLNELLQNALEHGFENRQTGKLIVRFKRAEDYYVLDIIDDGCGLPAGFELGKTQNLGLKIIQTLVEVDLGGSFELLRLPQGTQAHVVVPIRRGDIK